MKLLVTLVSGFRIFVQIRQRWQGREDRANVEIEMQPVQNLTRLQGAIDPAEYQTKSDIIHVSIAQTSNLNTGIQPVSNTIRTGEKHNDNQLESTAWSSKLYCRYRYYNIVISTVTHTYHRIKYWTFLRIEDFNDFLYFIELSVWFWRLTLQTVILISWWDTLESKWRVKNIQVT